MLRGLNEVSINIVPYTYPQSTSFTQAKFIFHTCQKNSYQDNTSLYHYDLASDFNHILPDQNRSTKRPSHPILKCKISTNPNKSNRPLTGPR